MLRAEGDISLLAALDDVAREPCQWGGTRAEAFKVLERTAKEFVAAIA
jgi:hypothetical protein